MTPPVVVSYGMGTDSTALLLRWIHEPATRPCGLRDLLVVTAQTGDEWPLTGQLVARHMLPLFRQHGIRWAEVARCGPRQADGITVLSDSRTPAAVHLTGAYRLSQEMMAAGTVPQAGGARKCSAKAKGWPLDQFIRAQTHGEPYLHVVGYEAGEASRAVRDATFNTDTRTGSYPLIEWGWDRQQCEDYILGALGVRWVKSACVYCLIWNLSWLGCQFMIEVSWEHFPLVEQHEQARRWLQFTANLGRAPNTVDAYGRGLEDHLAFCSRMGADPATVRADVVAAWIGDMHRRPNVRSGGTGLANATIQQRVIAVRGFYDFLVEEEIRERNPVRRGQSSRRAGRARQGLVRRVEKAPWIPSEHAWDRILRACEREPVRNRLMVTFAYDGALRREELVSLEPGDLEPAWSLIHLRAETTKSRRAREVSFGATSAHLLVAYLRQRSERFGRADGRLFVSESRRNRGEPLGPSSWSKIVTGIAQRAGVPQLSTHTFRHLRLTDLARAGWSIDEIAQYAGHRDLATTLKYIHLSGRELAAKLHKATRSLQADRERRLAALVEAW